MQCEFCAFPRQDAGGAPNAKRENCLLCSETKNPEVQYNSPLGVMVKWREGQIPLLIFLQPVESTEDLIYTKHLHWT